MLKIHTWYHPTPTSTLGDEPRFNPLANHYGMQPYRGSNVGPHVWPEAVIPNLL